MKRLIFLLIFPLTCLCLKAQAQQQKEVCLEIERFTDDSTHAVKLITPVLWRDKVVPVVFTKLVSEDTVTYTLYFSTHSDMTFKDPEGIVVVFTDSTVWRKPGRINAFKMNNSFEYNLLISLTAADVALFSTKHINNYVLYLFNQDIDKAQAEHFAAAVQCVKDAQ